MHIYDGIVIGIFLSWLFSLSFPNKRVSKTIFVSLVVGILILIQGLRAETIGSDLPVYKIQYESIKYIDGGRLLNYWSFEPLYNFVTSIFSKIGISFQFFLFLVSVFVLTTYGRFAWKYSQAPIISFLIYLLFGVYDFGFSGLRQIIAMSLLLISFDFILKKQFKSFFFLILIASFIHSTAILFLLLYLLINIEWIKNFYRILYPLIIIVILLFGNQLAILGSSFLQINENYIQTSYISGFGLSEVSIFLLFVLSMFLYRNNYIKNHNDKVYESMLLIMSLSVLVQFLAPYSYMFARLNLYFFQFMSILVTYTIKDLIEIVVSSSIFSRTRNYSILAGIFTILIFLIVFLIYHNLMLQGPHQVFPYQFFWEL